MSGEDIFNVDLDAVEELKDRSPIKPSVQRVRVKSVETKNSQAGNPMLVVVHEYVNKEELEPLTAGLDVQTEITRRFPLSQKALPFLRQFVNALGITWDAFKANRDPQQFVGQEAEVRIGLTAPNENGNRYNEISKYIVQSTVAQ